MRRRTWFALLLPFAAAALWLVLAEPGGARSLREFDPDRTADLELRMWQAYYAKQRVRLFGLLVELLREQFHYSWADAGVQALHLARAAAAFGDATGQYDAVLPDLTQAYRAVQRQFDAPFAPADVARAELAWWVARRVPETRAPEQVGRLIAEEYALLYGVPVTDVLTAGRLRAEAAALRDRGAAQPDWAAIARTLTDSYRRLHGALHHAPRS